MTRLLIFQSPLSFPPELLLGEDTSGNGRTLPQGLHEQKYKIIKKRTLNSPREWGGRSARLARSDTEERLIRLRVHVQRYFRSLERMGGRDYR